MLCLLLSGVQAVAMSEREVGMRTLETIKTATVCCLTLWNYVDSCTGRNAMESLSQSVDKYYGNQHYVDSIEVQNNSTSIVTPTLCFSCCKHKACCLDENKK